MSYQTEKYADSLAEFGTPLWLPNCRGWVLQRKISPVAAVDAMGCYPLFCCEKWAELGTDLAVLRAAGLVTLTMVTDPLGQSVPERLREWFPDVAQPYKEHYLVDLSFPGKEFGSAHHRRNVRRYSRRGRVEVCNHPAAELEQWLALYDQLIARHDITGVARFSRESFRRQLAMPGVTLLRAVTTAGEIVGMQIWVSDCNNSWYHLGAYSDLGYRLGGASSALTAFALDHFRQRGVRWANLGSGAGLAHDASDGLSRFKRGWSTETRWAWLCGVVLDQDAYAQACEMTARRGEASRLSGPSDTDFFPPYRAPRLTAPKEVLVHGHAD